MLGCIQALSEGLFSSQLEKLKLVIPVWGDLRGAAVGWMFLWELFLQSSGAAGWSQQFLCCSRGSLTQLLVGPGNLWSCRDALPTFQLAQEAFSWNNGILHLRCV